MSIYGHYSKQYYGNHIGFPENSFLISGISFYQEYLQNISYQTELDMKLENNEYDNSAIAIYFNENKIGYIPKLNKEYYKEIIEQKLKIINIKSINGNIGIRCVCY